MAIDKKINPVQDKPNRNRRPMPADAQGPSGSPTTASSWKKKTVGGTLVTVPSGNTCLITTPGMQAFIRNGVIPNSLMGIVQESMKTGQAPSEESLSPMLDDPKKLAELMQLADDVVVYCCLDPKVAHPPKIMVMDDEGNPSEQAVAFDDPSRDEDILYVDEVDLSDKMYIFNIAVGGPSDMAPFRQEQKSDVVAVQPG